MLTLCGYGVYRAVKIAAQVGEQVLQDGHSATRRCRQRELTRRGRLQAARRPCRLRPAVKVPRRARVGAGAAAVQHGRGAHGVLARSQAQRRDAVVVALAVVGAAGRPSTARGGSAAVQVRGGGGQRRRRPGRNDRRRTAGDRRPFQRDSGHESAAAGDAGCRAARPGDADAAGRRLVAGEVLPHRGRWRRRRWGRHDGRQRTDGAETPRKALGAERRVDLGRVPRAAAGAAVRRRRVAVAAGWGVEAVGGVVERLTVSVQEPGELVMGRGRRKAAGAFQRHVEVSLLLAPFGSPILKPHLQTHNIYTYKRVVSISLYVSV